MALKERTHENQNNTKIIEAVETLSHIADMEIDKHVGIAQHHHFILNDEKITYDTVHWLTQEEADKTVKIVKETFKTILSYLRNFYKKEYGFLSDPKAVEGIKTIMVLVGEAAKKLDQCTSLKKKNKSVTELKEYKQLQEFYLNRIARKIDEKVLGKWILALTQNKPARKSLKQSKILTKHIFVDLESVKKDADYELFFIKKEDGSRFYSPRLIRNIKLLCDFGDYFGNEKIEDPLKDVNVWNDKFLQKCAKNILANIHDVANEFCREYKKFKEKELSEYLNKALFALVLSSSEQNCLENHPHKSCRDYFHDFQIFLRKALFSPEYHKLIAYPPNENNKLGKLLLQMVESLCSSLFEVKKVNEEMISSIHQLIHDAVELKADNEKKNKKRAGSLTETLEQEYAAVASLLKVHPYGSLNRILNTLQEGFYQFYDPMLQKVLPIPLYQLTSNDRKIISLGMGCPISQEYIQNASVLDEFKAYLHHLKKQQPAGAFLLINFQDRFSWKDQARARAVEALTLKEANLKILSLPRDSDFYHQNDSYENENQIKSFYESFLEEIQSENKGFYFPEEIKNEVLLLFEDTFRAIHKIFFNSKNALTKGQRLDFIELFYSITTLKAINLLNADRFAICCKDGIDQGAIVNGVLYSIVKLINQPILNEKEKEHLDWIIYTGALLHRERAPLSQKFYRSLGALRRVEQAIHELGREKFIQEIKNSPYLKDLLNIKVVE